MCYCLWPCNCVTKAVRCDSVTLVQDMSASQFLSTEQNLWQSAWTYEVKRYFVLYLTYLSSPYGVCLLHICVVCVYIKVNSQNLLKGATFTLKIFRMALFKLSLPLDECARTCQQHLPSKLQGNCGNLLAAYHYATNFTCLPTATRRLVRE